MLFEDHLYAPRGLGALREWPHCGAAGGAACGDVIRIAVRVQGDRIAEAGFDAEGCGAARAAGSAVVELVEGKTVLDAARITPDGISEALGGLIVPKRHAATLAADALHRALGSAAKAGAVSLAPSARRTLVAMSGGVDSAAAAQLALDAGDEVVAVTLELWSDPATDGERSCCSAQAVTGARALAHRMGVPHLTLDLRRRFRAEVVDPLLDGYAEGRTPNPCVRCNGEVRFDAMLDLAASLGAARLATGHYARIARDEHAAVGECAPADLQGVGDISQRYARIPRQVAGQLRTGRIERGLRHAVAGVAARAVVAHRAHAARDERELAAGAEAGQQRVGRFLPDRSTRSTVEAKGNSADRPTAPGHGTALLANGSHA